METLPSEVVTQILEYLPFDERRAMATLNKIFYDASTHPVFSKKEWLTYKPLNVDLKNFIDFKNMVMKSRRKLFCLKFDDLTFIDDLTIFKNLGNHIISLHFHNLKLLNDSFLDAITQYCKNLEEFELVKLADLFITDKIRTKILKLRSITLNHVQISDNEFNIILKFAPNLKDLCIFNCNINYRSQIIQRFYPQNTNDLFNKFNSDLIFSNENIVHHLNNSVSLNCLKLNTCCNILYQIQPSRNDLQSLVLNLKDIEIDEIENFKVLSQYVSLRELEMSYLPVDLLSSVSKLYNLQHLKLSYFSIPIDGHRFDLIKSFIESLKHLKHIKTLTFFGTNTNDPMFDTSVIPFPECMLKSLTSLTCCFDPDVKPLFFSKNLTNLNIKNGNILKVEHLQLLFREFTNLKHLHIDQCNNVNDLIFINLPISNLKELVSLKLMNSKLSYRCLYHITNSNLKDLILTNVSLEPLKSKCDLTEFEQSLIFLSKNIPMLTQLVICVNKKSLRAIESLDLFSYFRISIKILITQSFKRIKMFKFWD